MLGRLHPEVERGGDVDPFEVLVEVPHDVLVVAARGEDVDEPEELRLEGRVVHRPVEQTVRPPSEVVDASTFGGSGGGDPPGESLDVTFE